MNVQERAPGALEFTGPPIDIPPNPPGGVPIDIPPHPPGGDRIQTLPAPPPAPAGVPVTGGPPGNAGTIGNIGSILGGLAGGGGMLGSLINEIMQILQELLGLAGQGGTGSFPGGSGGLIGNNPVHVPGGESYFTSAHATSAGDPHLSFNGTDQYGNQTTGKYDSMVGHADLLDSNSFTGGYKISTSVTAPNAEGKTYNQQATVTTDAGGTSISLDRNGNALVTENGHQFALADGQSMNLGNGETVRRNAAGVVTVSDYDAQGGSIVTTLKDGEHGVDVGVKANGVDLGGDLLSGFMKQPQETPLGALP